MGRILALQCIVKLRRQDPSRPQTPYKAKPHRKPPPQR